MRVFVATMFHETSAFSPVPTSETAFTTVVPYTPEGTAISDASRALPVQGTLVRVAEAAGCAVYASSFLFAQPSARCTHNAYRELRDRILNDLARHGPFDVVLLVLHGAQMAIDLDDCEGDLLARCRDLVGRDVTIGVILDLHANVTSVMTDATDVMLACREYPHTDFDVRADQLFRLCTDAAFGKTRPLVQYRPVPVLGRFYTTDVAMAALTADAAALEGADQVLAVSLIHGFPYANTPDASAGVLLVTDDAPRAEAVTAVERLRGQFFALRAESLAGVMPLMDVLDHLEAAALDCDQRPFIVADYADNAGGGAASDSTFILGALLARGMREVALGMIWDPVAVTFARDAGVGATLGLRLGGKCGAGSGHPLDVVATVLAVRDDVVQHGLGLTLALGTAVALDIDGIKVVVNTERQQVYAPTCFTELGIDLTSLRAVFVKSTQHFRATFEPLARDILYVDTPGDMTAHITAERFDNVARPIWPLDEICA